MYAIRSYYVSDTSTSQQSDMIPKECAEHAGIRANLAIPADLNARADRGIWPNPATFPNDGSRTNHSPGRHTRARMHLRLGRDTRFTGPIQMPGMVHLQLV